MPMDRRPLVDVPSPILGGTSLTTREVVAASGASGFRGIAIAAVPRLASP
jgi:hypothetical protein